MEGNRRRLGWLVIGIGALVLAFMAGGHMSTMRASYMGYGNGPQAHMQSGPRYDNNATAPQAPSDRSEMRGGPGFGPGFGHGHHGQFGPGFGGFLFGPLRLLGGLANLVVIGLLAFVALKWFTGRRGGDGASGGPSGPRPPTGGTGGTSSTGETYTGDTQSL